MNPSNLQKDLGGQAGFNLRLPIIITSLIIIVSYGIFTARNMLLGPRVQILEPQTREIETTERLFVLRGIAKNTISLTLNEKEIYIDTEGNFNEKILLSPGFNLIKIRGQDRFKNQAEEAVKAYYKE